MCLTEGMAVDVLESGPPGYLQKMAARMSSGV